MRPTLLIVAALALPLLAPNGHETTIHGDVRGELEDVNLAAAVAAAQAQAGGADGLGTAWCGDPRTGDDTDHAAYPAERHQIKVVYAYAADRPDRSAAWANALQSDVAVVQRYLSSQSGGTKAVRFDMGTRCGPEFADIQVVPLPGPRSSYAGDFRAIASAVQAAIGAAGPRNAIVLADSLSTTDFDYGLAETVVGGSGDRPDASNPHNRGGLTGVLFSRDSAEAPTAGWWPEGFLHEVTHTLGAVQWSAPHSTQPQGQSDPRYGHCWQGADVMCYAEDAGAAHPLQTDCAPVAGTITQSFDCGRDDYFNPAPAPGSYLATHWNVYDSAFLASCAEIAPACGGDGGGAPRPPAPASGPAIEGATRRGAALRATPGTWINEPSRVHYQWQRLSGRRWRDIRSGTGPRYVAATRDVGRRLRVRVTASNPDGRTAAASAPTAPVGAVAVNRTASARSRGADRVDRRKAGRR